MPESAFPSPSPTNQFGDLLRGTWQAIEGQRARFLLFVGLFVVAYSTELLAPWAIGYVLGAVTQYGAVETLNTVLLGVIGYVALKVLQSVCHHYARYVQVQVGFRSCMHALNRIFRDLLALDLAWHTRTHSGDSFAKLQRTANAVDSLVSTYAWQVIEGGVKVVLAAIALLVLDVSVAAVVIVTTSALVYVLITFNRRAIRYLRESKEFESRINRVCVDNFTNIFTIKTLHLEPHAERHLSDQESDGLRTTRHIARINERKWGVAGVAYALVIGVSLMLYFYQRPGTMDATQVAELYVLISYLDKILQAISPFTSHFGGLVEASISYEDASMLGHRESELPARVLPSSWEHVRIEGLRFSYVQRESKGLDNVTFEFSRGDKIALIGPSGGGKSTLLKALGGVLHPERALVVVDGMAVHRRALAHSALLVPHDPQIFSESFGYNITMGEEFTLHELEDVLAICRLHELLSKLPDGWHTNLAENGLNLSGGEKQRVALARGLLRARRRDLILLDEPTSSLDPKTERALFEQVLRRYHDRTILMNCHRWSLLPMFDYLLFLEDGVLKERVETNTFLNRLSTKPESVMQKHESQYVDYLPAFEDNAVTSEASPL